jgi:hypothetical protein
MGHDFCTHISELGREAQRAATSPCGSGPSCSAMDGAAPPWAAPPWIRQQQVSLKVPSGFMYSRASAGLMPRAPELVAADDRQPGTAPDAQSVHLA